MSAASSKRARACDACHTLKIKCELGTSGGPPPCARCVRLSKDCVVTPAKRQKDRVAELEAQVAALTKLLESQGIKDLPTVDEQDPSPPPPVSEARFKKRRLSPGADDSPAATSSVESTQIARPRRLDQVVPLAVQSALFDKYRTELARWFPLVPVPEDATFEQYRCEKPLLLEAMIYAASSGVLDVEQQQEVATILMGADHESSITSAPKSIELLEAIGITCLWYRTPTSHRYVAVYYLVDLANKLVRDLKIASSQWDAPSGGPYMGMKLSAAQAWRALLGSYLLSTSSVVFLRKTVEEEWSHQHYDYLQMLEYSAESDSSDRLLSQHFRAHRLCVQVNVELEHTHMDRLNDVSDPIVQEKMLRLQDRLLDWQFQLPTRLRHESSLQFWQFAATLYIHESVLHTTTNKESFRAPYIVEGLSVTDFARPARVTPQHVAALRSIIASSHSLIDLFTSMDTLPLMALPGLLFASRIAYAMHLLVKVYITLTAAGNTYGQVLYLGEVRVNEYLDKMARACSRVMEVDSRVGTARILGSAERMTEWLAHYNDVLSADLSLGTTPETMPSPGSLPSTYLFPAQGGVAGAEMPDIWEDLFPGLPNGFDFDFDTLFVAQDVGKAVVGGEDPTNLHV